MKPRACLGILMVSMAARSWGQPLVVDGGKGNIRINCAADLQESFQCLSPGRNVDQVNGHGSRGRTAVFWDRSCDPARSTSFDDLRRYGLREFDGTPFRSGGCGRRVIFLDACQGGSLVVGPDGGFTSSGRQLAQTYNRPVICAAGDIEVGTYRVTLRGGGCGAGQYFLVFPDGRQRLLSQGQIEKLMQCNPSLASGGGPTKGGLCVVPGGRTGPTRASRLLPGLSCIPGLYVDAWRLTQSLDGKDPNYQVMPPDFALAAALDYGLNPVGYGIELGLDVANAGYQCVSNSLQYNNMFLAYAQIANNVNVGDARWMVNTYNLNAGLPSRGTDGERMQAALMHPLNPYRDWDRDGQPCWTRPTQVFMPTPATAARPPSLATQAVVTGTTVFNLCNPWRPGGIFNPPGPQEVIPTDF